MFSKYNKNMGMFCDTLSSFFEKSISEDFISFIRKYSEKDGKWILCSDYCLHDKNKNNNVISFTLFPYIFDFNKYNDILNAIQSKDLKKTKKVSEEFNEWLKSGLIYNINFIINDNCDFYKLKSKNELVSFVDDSIENINSWIDNAIVNKHSEIYQKYKKQLKLLKNEMQKNSFNIKLFVDSLLVCIISAYLYCFIEKHSINISVFSWLSDRDNMNTSYHKVQLVFYELFVTNIEYIKPISKQVTRCIFNTDLYNGKELPYDAMNRVSDIICGTLADYNFDNNSFSSEKQQGVFLNSIVNNKYVNVVSIKDDGISRMLFAKKDK